ncbi:tartronate-semialdehyde synthase [Amycolatopsis arida]|uniref:Tartronate-semialdehyde synthase n=1 Tax=Amycolatopsis arida TaxID=587909 RepID=A0A1I5KGF8_9PSEU|nr:glyoxylate carboligase [Amycolatopsis arida]TDX97033.1 tartronate-semialdehyde synthase [Amycolatopsis arida]SFO84079.1 tartronate-semialdehyde synthase [Amycolatopsis arida]
MPKIPVMQAVVDVLTSEGVTTVFGCPGAAILPLYAAMRDSDIEHLVVRHEEGATHMADGWARTTGNVGVAIGTSGPAGTNMITGLYTAQADSIPILCITGQADSRKLHQEAFQAVDIVEIAKPVTKWAVQVKEAAQAPWIFREAFRLARSGRPGPVLIDLPLDVQRQEIEWDSAIDAPLPVPTVLPQPARVERALDLLLAAERPLILAGGGVVLGEAGEQLRAVAERLGVPVGVTLMGKGSFPEDHELYAGMAGIQTSQRWANAAFLDADLVLALGARFGDRHTGALDVYRGERTFIHVDIEPTQLGRVFGPDLGVVSDTREFLTALLAALERRDAPPDRREWVRHLGELRRTLTRREDFADTPIKPPRVFAEINRCFGPETYFVTAIGLYQIWSGQFQRAHRPRHYQVCGQAGPLGWEIPAAIGVKKARPGAEVVGVVGDYSFQFLVEELAVAAQYDIPFVLVMLNNEYLGLIRQAETGYGMNYEVDIHYDRYGTDNVKIMEAYGCAGTRVVEPAEIAPALEWARKEAERINRPVLVEIMIEREADAAMGTALDSVREAEPVP